MKETEAIGKASPNLRHGFLSFDEIHVNPKKQLAPNGTGEFGMAQNASNELASSVLVFQYVALFSRKKFVVNVAWYGCGNKPGLNTETLEDWLWSVMVALQRHGFRVHELVCDGLSVNRCLQKKLVQDAIAAGSEDYDDFVIEHPLATNEKVHLFLLSDPSHAVKKWRNNWFNREMAFSPTAPDPMFAPLPLSPDLIRWSDLEDVRTWQNAYPRVDRRLAKKHLDMNNYTKMNVQSAVDVVSEPIEAVMIENDALGTTSSLVPGGTRYFMKVGRAIWLAVNDRRTYFYEEEAKPLFEQLDWATQCLLRWQDTMERTPETFLREETYTDVLLLCRGFPAFMRYLWDVVGEEIPGFGFKPRIHWKERSATCVSARVARIISLCWASPTIYERLTKTC